MAKTNDEQIKRWREMGVKSIGFFEGEIATIEFFPPAASQFGALDLDTLVPPPPEVEAERPATEARAIKVAPALARLLKNGSVS